MPLIRAEDKYEGTLFDVAAPIEYFVEAVGVRSPVYTLKVADMPYVQKLELEYHFPAYTGLQPRKIEDGGDIAVLRGTEIRVRAVPTMAAAGGAIVIDDKTQVPMTVQADGALTATFVADHDGFYRIDLDAPGGPRVNGSPKYSIDVLTDQPPTVSFTKPGRDTSASPIEEVFLEAKAEDDYGVKTLDLVYSVNGGAEKTVKLFDGTTRMPNVSAGHTLYLEETERQAGRLGLVLRARRRQRHGRRIAEGDERSVLRPRPPAAEGLQEGRVAGRRRRRRRRAAEPGRRALGAAAADHRRDVQHPARSQDQRAPQKLSESSVVVGLMQKRLREQVNELLDQLRRARRQPGGALQEDHRLPEAEPPRDADRRRQAAGGEPRRGAAGRSTARSSSSRRRKRSTSCR